MASERPAGTTKTKGMFKSGSVRYKLTMYFILFALIFTVTLWLLQTMFLENNYESAMGDKMQSAVNLLSVSYADLPELDSELFMQQMIDLSTQNDLYFYIEARDGSFTITSTDEASTGRLYYYAKDGVDLARERLAASEGKPVTLKLTTTDKADSLTMVYAAKVESRYRSSINLFAFAPLTPMGPAVGILAAQLMRVTVVSLIAACGIALYISGRIAKPITDITRSASRLAEGDYDVEFQGSAYDEIDELAGTLNYTARELSKSEALRRDLMANVSHDLRTPLTMVKSYAEMIRDISGDNPEKRDEHINVIIREADRLSYLVNDILALSRLQAGVDAMRLEAVDIQDCAAGVVETYQVLEEQEAFRFEFVTLPQTIMVSADRHRIAQVISNFLSNAIRYSEESRDIKIEFEEDGDSIKFSVTDHGIGIAQEDLQSIWNRYERASSRGQRSKEGTGLGLSISKEILQRHGAKYGVESRVGEGSVFWFSLPILKERN